MFFCKRIHNHVENIILGDFHMAAKGATFDNDLLNLIFKGTAIANIADNAAS